MLLQFRLLELGGSIHEFSPTAEPAMVGDGIAH